MGLEAEALAEMPDFLASSSSSSSSTDDETIKIKMERLDVQTAKASRIFRCPGSLILKLVRRGDRYSNENPERELDFLRSIRDLYPARERERILVPVREALTEHYVWLQFPEATKGDVWDFTAAHKHEPFTALAIKWFGQLLEALVFLHHTVKAAHLDVSLENLLIVSDHLDIVLCDFGQCTRGSKVLASWQGKYNTTAPELFDRGMVRDAHAADMWSAGICFYLMLLRSPPFARASKEHCVHFRRFCAQKSFRSFLKTVPSDAERQILLGLVVLEPSHRLSAQAALNAFHLSFSSSSSSSSIT